MRLGLLTAVWYLAYWICSQVNCIADYELDKTYKSRLPRSIDILKGPVNHLADHNGRDRGRIR